ncbi:MAG: HAD family phosphatase [Chloroflexi bacterium]|nr:HAD family phosphatase [Chloroflexota bacterium]
MTQKNLAIVFDLGGVLLDWNPRYLYTRFFDGDSAAMEKFLERIHFNEWNLQQDAGRPFAEAVDELCARYPDDADLIRIFDARWEDTLKGAIHETVAILSTVKRAGYPVYALSNWSVEKFTLVRPRYEFLSWFDDILVSGEVKLAKPDPRIFTLLLERIRRPAHECLLIDDTPANL